MIVNRAYSSRNWWTEMAVGVLVTLVCTALLLGVGIWALEGRGGTVNLLSCLVPGLAVGIWSARRYRRRHTA
ncbi:hypothetical protein AB0L96_05350 [Streptomyces sp. NPDC052115]|uniref:hypothetical protein n=1 Tax=Streptomyces sp. NPDC052115 TaxID=3155794 RepID=UPI003449020A